jgi:hypothetical protein
MTELEWLKQESGLTDDELKAMEAVAGHTKFVGMLQKIIVSNENAMKDKSAAEQARLDFENRYQNEFIPEMRKVTQDSLRAQGELAAAQARLKAAQEYGIVPEPTVQPTSTVEPPRAPGSPDPNQMSRDEFNRFSQQQSNTIIALNDLNAEHFRLFGQPLGDTQALVDEATRQRNLGNKSFTLKQAWETKHNVAAKREELSKAEQQKVIDAAITADRKAQAEKNGSNPNLRSGVQSRFSSYKPTDAAGGKEPWKASHSLNERNRPWRENAVAKIREAQVA